MSPVIIRVRAENRQGQHAHCRDEAEQVTKGGIILTKDTQKESNYGTIIAVGPGRTSVEMGCQIPVRLSVGQRVLFTDYHTTKAGGKDIVIVDEEDVLAVVC